MNYIAIPRLTLACVAVFYSYIVSVAARVLQLNELIKRLTVKHNSMSFISGKMTVSGRQICERVSMVTKSLCVQTHLDHIDEEDTVYR